MNDNLTFEEKTITRKLSFLFFWGFIELVAIFSISSYVPNHLKIGNTYTFPLGKMELSLKAPDGSIITTDQNKLAEMGLHGYFLSIQYSDTTRPTIISATIADLVDSRDLKNIESIMRENTNLEIVNSKIINNILDIEFIDKNSSSNTVVVYRIVNMFPYTLKFESAYNIEYGKPLFIDSVFNSIGVR